MTNFANLNSRFTAALLTVLFSAVTVLGAVGPAYSGSKTSQQATQTLANDTGKSANSLV